MSWSGSRIADVFNELRNELRSIEGEHLVADVKDKWIVVAEPVGMNPQLKPEAAKKAGRKRLTGKKDDQSYDNVGGVIVYVRKGTYEKQEVARVGFIRDSSENPNTSFKDKLDEIVDVAKVTCDTLNSLNPTGELV